MVVLPEPDSPTNATVSPACTSKDTCRMISLNVGRKLEVRNLTPRSFTLNTGVIMLYSLLCSGCFRGVFLCKGSLGDKKCLRRPQIQQALLASLQLLDRIDPRLRPGRELREVLTCLSLLAVLLTNLRSQLVRLHLMLWWARLRSGYEDLPQERSQSQHVEPCRLKVRGDTFSLLYVVQVIERAPVA